MNEEEQNLLVLNRISKENIEDALDRCRGDPLQAACLLGLPIDAMKHRADQLGLILSCESKYALPAKPDSC